MQTGLINITSNTTTTLVDEDSRATSFSSIAMTNTHASTAVTVELYVQDKTNTVEILSTLVNFAAPMVMGGTTTRFDTLTNVEVGDSVVFYDPVSTTVVLPQEGDPITVASLTDSTTCELSSNVRVQDDSVAKFYQLEKSYIIKTDVPGQTTLRLDSGLSFNNKLFNLKLKTSTGGLGTSTPLSVIIK